MISVAAAPGAVMTRVRASLRPVNFKGAEIFAQRAPTICGQYLESAAAEVPPPPNFLDRGRTTLATATPAIGAGRYCGLPLWDSSQWLTTCLSLRVIAIGLNDVLQGRRKAVRAVLQMKKQTDIKAMRAALLGWYDREGRTLPWRVRPEDRAAGVIADPYAVWLSEIMLQQTTVPHATPYWEKFLAEFPTVTDLANAERDRVLTLWAGLGYYARARNLHKCAGVVRDDFGGKFPQNEAQLLKLPGIGPYTAATMAAICFDEATNIVDGNVERVVSRIFKIEDPLPKGRPEYRRLAGVLASPERSGDYGQALMDLGATICSPRSPKCEVCVWQEYCGAYADGAQTDYPKKIKKTKLPVRYGAVFVLQSKGAVLLQQRPDKGLLGGMMGFPGSAWGERPAHPLDFAPMLRNWEKCEGEVKHVFTHFELRLDVYRAETSKQEGEGVWAPLDNMSDYALPTVMKKALKHALK